MHNLQSFQNISGFSNTNAVEAVVTLQSYIKSLSGLVAYYPMDETSGTTAVNQAPDTLGTLDGTITGATINQAGQSGASYSFDGVNDDVLTGYGPTILSTDDFSILFLAKISSTGNTGGYITLVGAKNTGAGATELVVFINNVVDSGLAGTYMIGSGGGDIYVNLGSGTDYRDDLWHLWSFVKTGTSGSLFIDTTTIGTDGDISATITLGARYFALGARNSTGTIDRYVKTDMQHVSFYNRVVTASERLIILQRAGLA